jgi:soluble lytic murein transglycosylase-like protein
MIHRYANLKRRDVAMLGLGALITIACFYVAALLHRQVPLAPKSAGITAPWIPATVKQWNGPIETMAKRYDLDPNFIAIIMTMESGGYAKADSGYAQGLMQITPATAKDIAARYLKKPVKSYNLDDPATSIEFGAAYLAELRDIYGEPGQGPSWIGTAELVAAAYNGGFGAANSLEQGKGLNDTQTVVYSRDAFNMWRERHAADSPTFDRWKERGGSALIDQAQAAMQAAHHA